MSRSRKVEVEEMQSVVADFRTLMDCMDLAVKSLQERGKDGVQIDGWDGVYSNAQSIRKQFAKIIGEANLPEIPFTRPNNENQSGLEKKTTRNKNNG
jgi:hypothetical protein